jgi:predicted RNA-binding Zn-ribbon protein involved in translation (DUF1610 family)
MKRCPKCGEWIIARYDQGTRKLTRKHECPKETKKAEA